METEREELVDRYKDWTEGIGREKCVCLSEKAKESSPENFSFSHRLLC